MDNGYTHLTAEVGYGGEVVSESVEVIKDASDSTDQDVKELINRTKQGMIIVEA